MLFFETEILNRVIWPRPNSCRPDLCGGHPARCSPSRCRWTVGVKRGDILGRGSKADFVWEIFVEAEYLYGSSIFEVVPTHYSIIPIYQSQQ